jgi:tetratricopeptide (TPR) repeat protein
LKLVLEDFVPYDESTAWKIHDAYFAERGIAAWTGGDIPFAGTSNSGVARQHARLFVELVRELVASGTLGPDEPVNVLEVGSGLGTFALNFVEALAHGCGAAGRDLVGRLRYVLSDYAPRNLEESTALPGLARLVAEGTIVPAVFDLRRPDELTLVASRARKHRREPRCDTELAAVFLNYICCVSPLKVVRETKKELLEKHVQLSMTVADEIEAKAVVEELAGARAGGLPRPELLARIEASYEWRRLDLARAFTNRLHRRLLPLLLEKLPDATINYPYTFLELLRGLRPRLRAGGMFLVSDFGNPDRAVDVQRLTSDRAPVKYGHALTHDVDFVLFDVFAQNEGMGIVRTEDGLLELHTVALRNMAAVPASFVAAFDRTHRRRAKGQELLDLGAAALVLFEAGRFHEAARLYRQCLRIAPRSFQVIYRFGQACLSANLESVATLERLARLLRKGRRLDASRKHDWDTLLGAVYLRLGDPKKARRFLVRSLERSSSAARHATLALVYESLGQRKRAYAAHLRALALEPDGEPRARAMERLFRDYLADGDPPRKRVKP